MSHERITQELIQSDEMIEDQIDSDDYCFIFNKDGKLKGAILPESLPFQAPKNIQKILKIFGVRDIANLDQEYTIH